MLSPDKVLIVTYANQDTVFSPVKQHTNGTKSINIKISAATTHALNSNKRLVTSDDEELQIEGSDSDQSQSPKSVGSSNSPSTKKVSPEKQFFG
jgi:hypothetical protein